MTSSKPAKFLALFGLVLQIPYVVWNVLGVFEYHLDWVKAGVLVATVLCVASLVLTIASPALAGASAVPGSRSTQVVLIAGALGATLFSVITWVIAMGLVNTHYDSPFGLGTSLKYALGFGDYSYTYKEGLAHASLLAWTASAIVLAVGLTVVLASKPANAPFQPFVPAVPRATTPMGAASLAPGWYPQASGGHRYWDGVAWTAATPDARPPTDLPPTP